MTSTKQITSQVPKGSSKENINDRKHDRRKIVISSFLPFFSFLFFEVVFFWGGGGVKTTAKERKLKNILIIFPFPFQQFVGKPPKDIADAKYPSKDLSRIALSR